MRIGYIDVERISTAPLSRDDLGVAGRYEIEWSGQGDAPDGDDIGDVMLEVFANRVPIAEPEDFDVSPLDTDKGPLFHALLPGELGTLTINLDDWRVAKVS